jgi:Fur family ferric uptake transcriptional regulator
MASPTADDLLERLRTEGLRATTQRRVIVEALLAQPAHITAEDLTALVNERFPEVHAATVYRTLEVLESIGVLYRLANGHAPTEWHMAGHSHQHLVCDDCGRVEEISNAAFARLASALARDHGFRVDMRHMAITGRCASCSE